MDSIVIPRVNPVHFNLDGTDSWFVDTIPYFEQTKKYCQKFQKDDTIRFQFIVEDELYASSAASWFYSTADPASGDTPFPIALESLSFDDLYTSYQGEVALTDVTEDSFIFLKLVITLGTGPVTYYSEPIHVKGEHEHTLLIEYCNDTNDFNMIFQPGGGDTNSFHFRVEGGLKSKGYEPRSTDVIYVNDRVNMTTVHSTPYLVKRFTFGDSFGIPWWASDILNRIFSCYYVIIDGIYYNKVEGAKFEATRLDYYPLAGWELELMENEEMNAFPPLPAPDQRVYYLYRNCITGDDFDPGDQVDDTFYIPPFDPDAGHTYSKFGLSTNRGELCVFKWDTVNDEWTKDTWGTYVPPELKEATYNLREGELVEIDPAEAGVTLPVFEFQVFETDESGNLYPQPGLQPFYDAATEKWYINAKETIDVLIRFVAVTV
ncbi:MAG: hypothetical protein WC871_03590 [Bacteroidales bacterium]|jgi:hypothetical protein